MSSPEFAHFTGCGGAGMYPLARIFHELGYRVSGTDIAESGNTEKLRQLGIPVKTGGHFPEMFLPEMTAENTLSVYTSAVSPDDPELQEARKRGIPALRRGEALARIGQRFPVTVAVGGSHGKTSVTGLLVHTLIQLEKDPGYLIGGTMTGLGISGTAGGGKYFITEVDESDSTIALFSASVGVVTNMEDDHAWSVGGTEKLYESFRIFGEKAGRLVYVPGEVPDRTFRTMKEKSRPVPAAGKERFPENWGGFQKTNGRTALAVLRLLFPEEPEEKLIRILSTFPGMERRLSLRYEDPVFRLVEDYAHHPTEVRASLEALRETNPGRRLVVIFQPHRYARLQRYFEDFVRILSGADRLFLVPVFAAWTDSSGMNSDRLAQQIGEKAVSLSGSWESMAETIRKEIRQNDLVAVIGAGDVNRLLPLLGRPLI